MKEPDYHTLYRLAWEEYRTCFDPVREQELQVAMDTAQNSFTFDEFQTFKDTLLGFNEFWQRLEKMAMGELKRLCGQ